MLLEVVQFLFSNYTKLVMYAGRMTFGILRVIFSCFKRNRISFYS